jgi:hypothetical protein
VRAAIQTDLIVARLGVLPAKAGPRDRRSSRHPIDFDVSICPRGPEGLGGSRTIMVD